MGRNKINIELKNVTKSISLLPQQGYFVDTHATFDLSKFVQLHLQQHMNDVEQLIEIERRES